MSFTCHAILMADFTAAALIPVPAATAAPQALPPQRFGTAPIKCHFDVSPGDYDVTVGLGSTTKAANTSMSVEARRQILTAVATAAERPAISSLTVTKANAPLVTYLAGDSTVCDQPTAPYTGWGQILPTDVFVPCSGSCD